MACSVNAQDTASIRGSKGTQHRAARQRSSIDVIGHLDRKQEVPDIPRSRCAAGRP